VELSGPAKTRQALRSNSRRLVEAILSLCGSLWMATTIAGQGWAYPVATAGNPTMGLSLMGALVSSVM
jgi:uncharacterized protein (DUF697 family)